MYDGFLDSDCVIDAYHEASDGDVVSKFRVYLTKDDGTKVV